VIEQICPVLKMTFKVSLLKNNTFQTLHSAVIAWPREGICYSTFLCVRVDVIKNGQNEKLKHFTQFGVCEYLRFW